MCLDARGFFRRVNCSNEHKIFSSCSLSPPPDSPPLRLPFPACLQPGSMLSVPWPTVWPLCLFVCEVRAGWHCASVCGQAVFTSVWPWSLEPGAVRRCILDITQKTAAGPGDRLGRARAAQGCLMNGPQSR